MPRFINILAVIFCIFLLHPIDHALSVTDSELNELYYHDGQRYFLYVPDSALRNPEEAYILAAIHGYSSSADDPEAISKVEYTALRWIPLADEYGWVILAPHFDRDRFNDNYQRLNLSVFGIGDRADLRLNELVEEVGRIIPGINSRKIYLFGFSGGGQFVHRYVAFHPDKVIRAVSAGNGWYMWPDNSLPYPVGTGMFLYGAEPKMDKLLASDLLVLVGSEDTTDSSFRESYGIYNLMRIQGETRWQRAQNWVNELEQMALRENVDLSVELDFAESTGHAVNYTMRKIATEYLTAETAPIYIRLSPWDVDMDGAVTIYDLVFVGENLGKVTLTAANPDPDVNDDGIVDMRDIIIVAQHLGEDYLTAAPARNISTADPHDVNLIVKIYNMMEENPGSDPDLLAAKLVLQEIMANLGTAKTSVYQNYPNPFNPETWIPYQLSKDSRITIMIYSSTGQIIKNLDLGYRKAGSYITRDSAAYWDGTTEAGEHAPSGVYFYNIQAENHSTTKKMTIIH